MALIAGSVSIDQSTEAVTSSGVAKLLYDADIATATLPADPTLGQQTTPYSAERPAVQADIDNTKASRLALKNEAARRANYMAQVLAPYMYGFGTAHVSATSAKTVGGSSYVQVDATSAPFTLTIPTASAVGFGSFIMVREVGNSSNTVTISDGIGTIATMNTPAQTLELFSNGTSWRVVRRSGA